MSKKKIGLIVNPIAGMGGKVGLKGTDGPKMVEKAQKLGAKPIAPDRAEQTLKLLKKSKLDFDILTCSGKMGKTESKKAGFEPKIIFKTCSDNTTWRDTRDASKKILDEKVDLLLFAGGDGTANDILSVVGKQIPLLGIPTGVKMHSAVFANTPSIAAKLVDTYFTNNELKLEEAEILDVNEEAFRRNELDVDLKGYGLTISHPEWTQSTKLPSASSGSNEEKQKLIGRWIDKLIDKNKLYILGPGTTTKAISSVIGVDNSTLLGVDIIKNRELIAKDVTESQILKYTDDSPAVIIVSPIGSQGFILGRGNQQISSEVIDRVGVDNVWIVATSNKLAKTPVLKVDTGSKSLDEKFRGYVNVIFRYGLTKTVPLI